MTLAGQISPRQAIWSRLQNAGLIWFLLTIVAAGAYFQTGIIALISAWSTPEYSHGPLIPVVSCLLFMRQLRRANLAHSAVDSGPGLLTLLLAIALGGIGRMIQIPDLVAYAIIVWVAGIVLVVFGWRNGRQFWPPVLHLIFMLPLPDVLYYGLSTYLQGVSSQLGVFFLRVLDVPVFLDGNIIDLGVYKLQVAEACSGLRYLFPILSFSYVFAVLYRGPLWHKAVLLLMAAPLTVVMNSVRIAIAGAVVDRFGTAFVEGVTHFMEGWVIFVVCVMLLFGTAKLLLLVHPGKRSLVEALDLPLDGFWSQVARLRLLRPTPALIAVALFVSAAALAWQVTPPRPLSVVSREAFYLFPAQLGDWTAGPEQSLAPDVEEALRADDYHNVVLVRAGSVAPVGLFIAWYRDQMNGGTHSPTDCLPGAGWEITKLDQVVVDDKGSGSFSVNRATIQKGEARMLVYYWYEQQGERTASSYYAKFVLTRAKVLSGRSDGALVRLTTPLLADESSNAAEARLQSALNSVTGPLPRFVPGA